MKKKKINTNIKTEFAIGILVIFAFLVAVIISIAGSVRFNGNQGISQRPIQPRSSQKACTQEAQICPDGTAVTRTGPNCVFAPCPVKSNSPVPEVSQPAKGESGRKTYRNDQYGFSFEYPQSWMLSSSGDSFLRDPDINVMQLHFETVGSKTSIDTYVGNFISGHNCAVADDTIHSDHIIGHSNGGIYYAEYCTAGTESYHYAKKLNGTTVLDLAYQENFDVNLSEYKKMEVLKEIISTLTVPKT